jgi:hypothetical protein
MVRYACRLPRGRPVSFPAIVQLAGLLAGLIHEAAPRARRGMTARLHPPLNQAAWIGDSSTREASIERNDAEARLVLTPINSTLGWLHQVQVCPCEDCPWLPPS